MKSWESNPSREKGIGLVNHGFLIVWAIISLFPLVWMISTSLKENNEIYTNPGLIPRNVFNFKNYADAWMFGEFNIYFMNSVLYTAVIISAVVFFSSLAAYGLSRLRMYGKSFIYYMFLASLVIPIPGIFVAIYIVVYHLGLGNSRMGYILPMIALSLPISIFILKSFFDEMSKEIQEAAIIDGATNFYIYLNIMIPILRPAIATIIILNMLSVCNEFSLALILFTDNALMPIQKGLSVFVGQYSTKYELLMAATTISIIPIVLIYMLMQKQFIQGLTAGAIKG
ncbi:MAG: carbohydrate ABC transporter permease [Bacilli bacterium]